MNDIAAPSLLDNIGIRIDIGDTPEFLALVGARYAMTGGNVLRRFWKREIRPIVKPRTHRRLMAYWGQCRQDAMAAFMHKVLEQINE